ncbi:MAG TPA: hypothetical protein VF043_34720 [Ktedonobacteraceae bacterium]
MEDSNPKQQKRRQDILQRIEQQLNVLEEPTTALLSNNVNTTTSERFATILLTL